MSVGESWDRSDSEVAANQEIGPGTGGGMSLERSESKIQSSRQT